MNSGNALADQYQRDFQANQCDDNCLTGCNDSSCSHYQTPEQIEAQREEQWFNDFDYLMVQLREIMKRIEFDIETEAGEAVLKARLQEIKDEIKEVL